MAQLRLMALALIFLSAGASAADGWKGPGEITFVQPEIYRQTNEGGYPILIGTTIPTPDCYSATTWVIRSDLDTGNRIYSAVLSAQAAGKQVQFYQWSCILVGGTYYGRVGAVKVLP